VEVAVEGRLTVNDPELASGPRWTARWGAWLYTGLGYAAPEIKAGRLVPYWRTGGRARRILSVLSERRQVPLPLQAFHSVPAGETRERVEARRPESPLSADFD